MEVSREAGEIWMVGDPLPPFFVSADSKGVTGGFYGSADCKGVRSEAAESWRRGIGFLGYTPGVLQKSAEMIDGERVGETLFFEECGRV